MPVAKLRWPALKEFRDRTKELSELEKWWASTSRDPINLYGRRRVGKSWLFSRSHAPVQVPLALQHDQRPLTGRCALPG